VAEAPELANVPESTGPAEPAAEAEPRYPAERRTIRERLAGLPTAMIVLVWVGVVLLGVVSAVSLTELASSSRAAAKERVAERAAGQAATLRPAATAVPAAPAPGAVTPAGPAPGDLGLAVPISRPACDGGYGVIVANATRPGAYRQEVGEFLARFSGASYLLAERACPSLRAHTEDGSSIYAVYYGPYDALGNACATRSRIGRGSYVRKLDNGPESSRIIKC
jgi:serine/threonine-protein kinase